MRGVIRAAAVIGAAVFAQWGAGRLGGPAWLTMVVTFTAVGVAGELLASNRQELWGAPWLELAGRVLGFALLGAWAAAVEMVTRRWWPLAASPSLVAVAAYFVLRVLWAREDRRGRWVG